MKVFVMLVKGNPELAVDFKLHYQKKFTIAPVLARNPTVAPADGHIQIVRDN
jgi:hypothetical protein